MRNFDGIGSLAKSHTEFYENTFGRCSLRQIKKQKKKKKKKKKKRKKENKRKEKEKKKREKKKSSLSQMGRQVKFMAKTRKHMGCTRSLII